MSSPSRHRFLSPDLLVEAVGEVAALARREGVRIALIGGFALQLHGSDRLTGDIDIAADARLRALPRGKALSFGGEATQAPNGVPVDWVLRDDDFAPLYDEAVARAVRVRGVPALVARPEHLVAMKMVAGRTRDTADLEFLLGAGVADPSKARTVVKKHLGPYAARELDRLAEEIAWKTSRGRT